ncbi:MULTISPECIES: PqqD family protein [Methanobacterium]|uniref:PqqD family protein n=1 Tax=Methanobacterium veterum TaxID=408577 RepID=A0A9E4ZX61_9EURY|nr:MULTISPECIES: PqqD family protein [Methanobacterium]MCZ3364275.1 PqqD family protein [Methanobacterium veterum]MCZ3372022.1 PqqD family protein [Methanobacterium veterum]
MIHKISDLSVISVTKEAVHCDVEDEVVILGLKDGVYYGLNPVGAFIWNNINQEPKTMAEIRDAVLEEYDVSEEVCEKDLMELLTELSDKGLIEVK